ncbi:MAG: hypothetical protein GC149_14880 [Gammaproteobacteria bacterium]|nr:hypothetical protein [Gammaproteobacteria bacterium]
MRQFLFLSLMLSAAMARAASPALGDATWFTRDATGQPVIQLYFYWSNKCPHCAEALPYIENLAVLRTDLALHSFQLVGEPDNVARYEMMASALGEEARSVPAFMLCNTMVTGFDPEATPQQLESLLNRCKQHIVARQTVAGFRGMEQEPIVLHLPFVGAIEAGVSSLPVITVLIAGVDAFNPCAFFVLMFLLSLMLHTGKRRRMLLVGGVFVFFSGLLYFLFMSAWLNLFRIIGHLDAITIGAAIVALIIGLINLKDFFWFKQGVSLTISDQAKPRLFQRMRNLLQARSLPTMMLAASGLALFANLYEFLCTAGFPMVYTRILTLSELSGMQYYAYLLLYNIVYVIPLLVIVLLFVVTMGARKLQEGEGRGLKLLSGSMMLILGLVLLLAPNLLQSLLVSLLVIVAAILLALIIGITTKQIQRRRRSIR